MPAAKVKCEIYESKHTFSEWGYRIIHGSRIVLVPGELYSTRSHCRRAVRNLAKIATDGTFRSPVASARLVELDREQVAWNKR